MNCLQCRAHWFFTALEKLLMNSTEVSGENLALKRRHPASTPPPLLTHWAPSSPPLSLFRKRYFQQGRNAAWKIFHWLKKKKKRGLKKKSAQGTAFSRWMWKYTLWLDSFYIWSISLVLWAQERPERSSARGDRNGEYAVSLCRRLMNMIQAEQDTAIDLKGGGG